MMGVSTPNSTSLLKHRRNSSKLDKPRSLKLGTNATDHNLETVLSEMEGVSQCLQAGVWDHRTICPAVASLCENLKLFGLQLENVYKDQLDKCFVALRTACRDDRLGLAVRYRLLEIIELRAMNWKPNQNLIAYYHNKLMVIEAEEAAMEEKADLPYLPHHQTVVSPSLYPMQYGGAYTTPPTLLPPQTLVYAGQQYQSVLTMGDQFHHHQPPPPTVMTPPQVLTSTPSAPVAPLLSPGEVVRTSGKFPKPTRIAGKNYCKDEVVIRNQDSGKVMGIKGRRVHMIEELSETIISFQRVAPGARERLVQITGPTEENIAQAKQLIEETIRRNASPAREAHSLSSGGGSSVFSSSPLNGSNSSIASHTDDENSSLNGCKRSSGNHSLSLSDTTDVTDYRYTVSHNNSNIRITGNSPGMVRTAKLILDEYFNGQKTGVTQLMDSSTPHMMKPATPPATPPLSSSSEGGDESPKNGGVNIVRQPLFPSSSKDAIDNAETSASAESVAAKARRAAFAQTQLERRAYSRSLLLELSSVPLSLMTPPHWSDVVTNTPQVIKKGCIYLTSLQEKMNREGAEAINSCPTYLQAEDIVNGEAQLKWTPKWNQGSGKTSSGTEE